MNLSNKSESKGPPPSPISTFFNHFMKLRGLVVPLIGVLIATVSLFVLWDLVEHTSRKDTIVALHNYDLRWLIMAALFTLLSYFGISLYDVVAVRTIAPKKIPDHVSALAGAAGYAISNALGFSFLTGGAIRFRIYAGDGIGVADVGRIISTSWFSMWFALFTIIGFALLLDPIHLPGFQFFNLTFDRLLGACIIISLLSLIIWLRGGEHQLRLYKFSLKLPGSKAALSQIAAGIIDLIFASATLYVLMPTDIAPGFLAFTMVYAIAVVIGVASHSPGGLGAFEATIIAGLGLHTDSAVLAALIVYRLIYTILPLLVATLGMVGWEVFRQRQRVSARTIMISRVVEPLIPILSAGLTFLAGIVLLISVVTPGVRPRLDILSGWFPLIFIETSNLAASVIGVGLLIVAYGLARRLTRAWFLTLCLLLVGAGACLTKGLDWEEAILLCIFAFVLGIFRHSFYRGSFKNDFSMSWSWLASICACVFSAIWLGFFIYRHVEYSGELWWSFAWNANAPRFLRASVVIIAGILVVTLYNIIHRPMQHRRAKKYDIPPSIPELVAKSPLADTALALLGDKEFLVDKEERGFIMYNRSGGSLIALGEPVSNDDEAIKKLAWDFYKKADRAALRTVFYGVSPKNLPLYLDMGLSVLKLGEVAKVYLPNFSLEGSKRQPFRYADRKAEREGLIFTVIPAGEVENHIKDLRAVSDAWLSFKSGAEKRFSIGYFDDDFLKRFDVAVMIKDNRIVAFANIWESGLKQEITVDMMRYLPNISKVMMEALFARILIYGKNQGYQWFNLGAAPLAGLSTNRLASRWHRIGSFIYRRGGGLYHFNGLKSFKEKFDPVWSPYYLICPGGLDTAKVLIDVTTLINGSPLEFFRK